jgi:hypothetical protein
MHKPGAAKGPACFEPIPKMPFGPFLCWRPFQILDIHQYASGLKLRTAAILSQIPVFEKGSPSGHFLTTSIQARRIDDIGNE